MIRPTIGVPLVIGAIWIVFAGATCVGILSSADEPAEAFNLGLAAIVVPFLAFTLAIVLCALLFGVVCAFEAWHAKRNSN